MAALITDRVVKDSPSPASSKASLRRSGKLVRGLSSKPPELEVFAEEGSNLRLVPQLSVVSALEGPARTKRPYYKGQ